MTQQIGYVSGIVELGESLLQSRRFSIMIIKERLLVVDDDGSVRDSLKKVLEETGYDVILAAGAEEAEGKIDAQEFDLLILDLNLPDRDGWDVL
ncbi:MAG: response regulator, partial [Verrucomicrobiales bacterium]|nr:response regulator [Verrucomicrobiales bacterium]